MSTLKRLSSAVAADKRMKQFDASARAKEEIRAQMSTDIVDHHILLH